MGTNYYAVKNRPTTLPPLHIGKSSAGWLFHFYQIDCPWGNPPVVWNTYNQVKDWLKKYTVDTDEYVIMDEYDEVMSFDDFFRMIDNKQNDKQCRNNEDNFRHCRNVDGYRFDNSDFC